MAVEQKKGRDTEGSFEYFHILAVRAAENLPNDLPEREERKQELSDFLEGISKKAEQSGDQRWSQEFGQCVKLLFMTKGGSLK